MRTCLLFSGGLDSLCAWHLMGEPTAVYVALGHGYERAETMATRALQDGIPRLAVDRLDGPSIGSLERPDGFIPGRNLALALAAAWKGYDRILLTALRGESSSDKTARFASDTSALISRCFGRRVELALPFLNTTKTGLVREYLRTGGDPDALRMTHSCYRGTARPCGRCMACFRRWVAMSNNGIEEQYEVHPATAFGGATGASAWHHLWRAGMRRWPDLLANNLDAARALRRYRRCT